jgi:hypothetical protein
MKNLFKKVTYYQAHTSLKRTCQIKNPPKQTCVGSVIVALLHPKKSIAFSIHTHQTLNAHHQGGTFQGRGFPKP